MPSYFDRNKQYAKPMQSYQTTLSAENEQRFKNWLALHQGRLGEFDPANTQADYDMRGWWLDNKGAPPPAGHFVDTYKTPYHQSFSNESKYALPNAPKWQQQGQKWLLVDPRTGGVVFAE